MGSSLSTPNDHLVELYKKYGLINKIEGGHECVVGGLADMDKYIGSNISSAKKELIKNIAGDMYDKLKIQGLNPKDKSIDQIVDALKEFIPDPRVGKGNRKIWSDKESNQVKACKIIGEIINNRFNSEVVDVNTSTEELCENISELVYSLFVGLHTEFLVVKKDVERILKNIKTLEKFMEVNHNTLVSKINNDKESSIGVETSALQEAHKDAVIELHKQQSMLENMLNVVIKPSESDMEALLKESNEFKTLVKKIKQSPGTSKFGEKVSYLMSGLRTVAAAAKVVDKALEKLGMSYEEYAKTKDYKDLKEMLSKKTQDNLNVSEKDLEALEKAKLILYSHQYMHDELIDELNKLRKEKTGSNEITGGLKLDKKVRRRQELRKQLLKAFNQRLSSLFDKVLISGKYIADSVGSGKIHLSDNLDKFVKALDDVEDIQKRYVYFALSGFRSDSESKQYRERFVGHVRFLISTIDVLIKDKDYAKIESFKDMKLAFEEINKLIEDYASRFAEGFGIITPVKGGVSADKAVDILKKTGDYINKAPEYLKKASDFVGNVTENVTTAYKNIVGKDELDEFEGGAEDIYPEITKISYMLDRSKDVVRYAFQTAKIKENLQKFSGEITSYGEDYTKILADAIANSVDSVITEKNKYTASDYATNVAHPLKLFYDELMGIAPPVVLSQDQKDKKLNKFNATVAFIAKEFDTKIELYRVAEAVDLYMKSFVDGLATNPNDIQDLSHILSSTEIVSQWFTNKSGDFLCQVFDTFPGAFNSHTPIYSNLTKDINNISNHYYLKVLSICRIGDHAGITGIVNANPNKYSDIGNILLRNIAPIPADWTAIGVIDRGVGGKNRMGLSIHPGVVNDVSLPGNPFLGIPIVKDQDNAVQPEENTAEKLIKHIEKTMSISVLKNIISMFINIGKKFGGKEIDRQIHMSPIQIYKALLNYIIYGSVTFGTKPDAAGPIYYHVNNADIGKPLEWGKNRNVLPLANVEGATKTYQNDTTIRVGFTAEVNLTVGGGAVNPSERTATYVTMRGVEDYTNFFNNVFNGDCDEVFKLILKSIVAKVLTTIGVYNMFEKPINKNGLGYQSELRLILGGGDDPKVIPEALELYVRLPLLAEFYREIFNFDDLSAGNMREISMIPEVDGLFSGLINIIFDKAKYVKQGEYSPTDINLIIEEVNKIYSHFSKSNNPINDAIREFVSDVNRRYGVIKREERTRYLQEKNNRFTSKYESLDDITDFELQGLDESDDYVRPAPSMSYQNSGRAGNNIVSQHKHKLDIAADKSNIDKLRKAIDGIFNEAKQTLSTNPENMDTLRNQISFSGMLQARHEELTHAKSDKEKLDIVKSSISSLGLFASSTLEKSLLLFNETVVHPLNNLYALYKILTAFENKINQMDDCLKSIGVDPTDPEYNNSWLGSANIPAVHNPGQANVLFGHITIPGGAFVRNDVWQANITPFMNNDSNNRIAANLVHNAIPIANIACEPGRQGLPLSDANGAILGLSYGEIHIMLINSYAGNNQPLRDKARNIARRFIIDQGKMLKTLIETLYTHTASSDLIKLNMNVQRSNQNNSLMCDILCNLDHSKLFEFITESYNNVKQNIDKFRGLLPKDTIEKYENVKTEGSIYWLEQNLILDLVQGKRTRTSGDIINIDVVNTKIKRIINYLNRPWNFNASELKVNTAAANIWGLAFTTYNIPVDFPRVRNLLNGVVNAVNNGRIAAYDNSITVSYHEFDRELESLVFYNPFNIAFDEVVQAVPNNGAQSGDHTDLGNIVPIAPNQVAIIPVRPSSCLESLLFNTSGKAKNSVAANAPWPGLPEVRYMYLYEPYDAANNVWIDTLKYNDARKSVFYMFNKLIAEYIKQAYDYTTKKIYATTINGFASGTFSSAVMSDKNFVDDFIEPINNILVGGTKQGVLYRTLAVMLRQLTLEMDDRSSKRQYYETDINEIPLFLKEKYRANFPLFEKLFTLLIKKCDLLKNFVKGFNVTQQVDLPAPLIILNNGKGNNVSRQTNEIHLTAVLDQIIQGSRSINQCIKETLTEIDVDVKYMDLYNGFISNYENENGVIPYMPSSSITFYLKDMDNRQGMLQTIQVGAPKIDYPLLPVHDLGTNLFKAYYGMRKLLTTESLKLDNIPGVKDIIKQHNNSVNSIHQFNENELEKSINTTIQLSKYIVEFKHHASYFNSFHINNNSALLNAGIYIAANMPEIMMLSHAFTNYATELNNLATYQLKMAGIDDLINLTESTSQKEQKNKVIDNIKSSGACPYRRNRKAMLAFNIIDMNIVPINVHALMREIPLVNLINYSYTFDHLISEIFNVKLNNLITPGRITLNDLIGQNNDMKIPTKTLLGHMLINPYVKIDYDSYEFYVSSLIRGNTGIEGFGRPKYLGDEVFNKALFGEIYPGTIYEDEHGPPAGVGKLRGVQDLLTKINKDVFGSEYRNFVQSNVSAILTYMCDNVTAAGMHNFAGNPRTKAELNEKIKYAVESLIDVNGEPIPFNDNAPPDPASRQTIYNAVVARTVPGVARAINGPNQSQIIATYIMLLVHLFNMPVYKLGIMKYINSAFVGNGIPMDQAEFRRRFGADNYIISVLTTILQNIRNTVGAGGNTALHNGLLGNVTVYHTDIIPRANLIAHMALIEPTAQFICPAANVIANRFQLIADINNGADIVQNIADVIHAKTTKIYNRYNSSERNMIESQRPDYFPNALHYLEDNNGVTEVKQIELDNEVINKRVLQTLGKFRFDTVLVRNLFWITNIQRALRLKLRTDLSWYDTKVVKDLSVTSPGITESFGNDLN